METDEELFDEQSEKADLMDQHYQEVVTHFQASFIAARQQLTPEELCAVTGRTAMYFVGCYVAGLTATGQNPSTELDRLIQNARALGQTAGEEKE